MASESPFVLAIDVGSSSVRATLFDAGAHAVERVAAREAYMLHRAITEVDDSGFIKIVHRPNGKVLGATIVAGRAGEMIHEWVLAIDKGLKVGDLSESIHVYPTYSIGSMQLAASHRVEQVLAGNSGRFVRGLTRLAR